MYVVTLRVKNNKKKKDFHFANLTEAAKFEDYMKCLEKENNIKLSYETFADDIPVSTSNMKELAHNPKRYAENSILEFVK